MSKKQKITNVVPTQATVTTKYPIVECFNYLKNMYTNPTYSKLIIKNTAWMKLNAFINLVGDYEISGFGRIEKQLFNGVEEDIITDFDIIRQEVKKAYVESDEDAVMEFLRKIPNDQRNEWILDWHSHVDMGTTPSSTDWDNYSSMLKARMNNQFPAMIVNKKHNVTAYQIICDTRHEKIDIYIDTTPIDDDTLWQIYTECKEKVETLCTKYVAPPKKENKIKSWTTYNNGFKKNNYTGYYSNSFYDDYDETDSWWSNKKIYEKSTIKNNSLYCQSCGIKLTEEEMRSGFCVNCFPYQ